jgi:DNA-binding HxlR family transcriptional regulator
MTIKYKNIILEKIKNDGSLTDKSLSKALAKDGYLISDDLFNKTLLDLEIMGLVNVSWITKNTRRVETVTGQIEDEVEIQNKKMLEKDYEASFPKANGTSS